MNTNDPTTDFKAAYTKLLAKVKSMRLAQKEYFKKRKPKDLVIAKEKETDVDKIIFPEQPSQAQINWLAQ